MRQYKYRQLSQFFKNIFGVFTMKFLKQTVSLLLAAVIALGGVAAFAEAPGSSQSGTQAPAGDLPFDGDRLYQPISLAGYVKWDGKSDFKENTKYYINSSVQIGKDTAFTLPKSSKLVVCDGAELLIYIGGALRISGEMSVAQNASFTSSGVFSVQKGGSFESFGTTVFTMSSEVNISSIFIARSDSSLTFSGVVNVYNDGEFIGYGQINATQNSQTTVTGVWQAPDSGKLFARGQITITLSGMLNVIGYMTLSGTLTNSGVMTIDENARYFTTKSSRTVVTRSGRTVDYRYIVDGANPGVFKTGGIKGIDVSVWQGVIDWKRVKKAGVQFAIIRSSYSDDKVDRMFEYNITEAQKAGVLVGVYHYCYATTPEEARAEARHFIETIKPYRIDYPVMFDFEDDSQRKLGKDTLTQIAVAFMEEIDTAGYYGMIYSYKNWLTDNLDMSKLSRYEVAVAEWNVPTPTYKGRYGMWQYSCKGIVSGIDGDVDLDICYMDYSQIIKLGGYNHLSDFE